MRNVRAPRGDNRGHGPGRWGGAMGVMSLVVVAAACIEWKRAPVRSTMAILLAAPWLCLVTVSLVAEIQYRTAGSN